MRQFLAIIDGPMGSGKTTLSKMVHGRIDNVALLGLDSIKWALSGFSRTSKQNAMTGHVVQAMARAYFQDGASVILDEGFGRAEVMEPYLDLADQLHVAVFVFQLDAPDEVLLDRLSRRPTPKDARVLMPLDRTVNNIATHRKHKYKHATIFDTAVLSPDLIADQVVRELTLATF
jgi:predicted kinase